MASYVVAVPPSVMAAAEQRGEFASGQVWKTDRFPSRNPLLKGLEGGGSLFLVTVSLLGFVTLRAVLDDPVFRGGEWVAPKRNTIPLRYVSMNEVSFAKAGWPAIKKKWKSMLRTPHALTDADDLVLRGGVARAAKVPELRLVSSLRPRAFEDLDAVQKKQLGVAGRGHDGKRLSASARLAPRPGPHEPDPNESFAGYLQILGVADEKGTLLYDVFVCSPDSGTVFRAGTITRVAEMIQGGLQCADPLLAEALRRAIAKRRKAPSPAKKAVVARKRR